LTSTPLSFPKIGDETLALRIAAKFRDAQSGTEVDEGSFDSILSRRGPVVSTIVGSGLDTLTYVKRADGKVKAILKPCRKTSK